MRRRVQRDDISWVVGRAGSQCAQHRPTASRSCVELSRTMPPTGIVDRRLLHSPATDSRPEKLRTCPRRAPAAPEISSSTRTPADLLQQLLAHTPPGSQGQGGTKRSTRSRDSPRQPGEACGPNSGATEPSCDGNRKVPPLRIPLTRMTLGVAQPASPDTPPQAPAHNDDVQRPTLSFQECLDYDLPPRKRPKKKKEPSKATTTQTSRGCPAEDHREQPLDENCIPLEEAIALLAGLSALPPGSPLQ